MSRADAQYVSLIRSLEQLASAMDAAIEALAKDRDMTLATIKELRIEQSVVGIAHKRNVAQLRQGLTAALNSLEVARGQARLEVFRALQHEGQSIGQIARLWGISRQLASRLIRDHPSAPFARS